MYSLVLMAALVGSAETPDCGRGGCSGCYGCEGGGCHGGGRRHGCHGGSSCSGGYGCSGYGGYASSCGCSGSYGGCYGGYASGGCTGGYAGYGYGCTGGMMPWGGGMMPGPDKMPPADKKGKDGKDGKDGTGMGPAPATIRVSLPADAKLLVDSYQTTSTSESRLFVSPALEPEKEFSYTLTAEIVRNGEKMTVSEVVKVRAGVESVVSLPADKFTSTVAKK